MDFTKLHVAGSQALHRLQKSTQVSGTEHAANCTLCSDTGVVIGPGGAARCECVKRRARERFYATIPAEFRTCTLATAVANSKRHPRQAEALSRLRENPFGSFLIFGENGSGKTFLAYLLVMNAYEEKRHAVAIDLDRLLKQYRVHEFGNNELPAITSEQLRPGPSEYVLHRADPNVPPGGQYPVAERQVIEQKKFTIFLDEISATRPTEYAAQEFFHLLKTAHEFEHQVIMTCNVTPQELQRHWSRTDAFWANSIARRIAEYMTQIDLTR